MENLIKMLDILRRGINCLLHSRFQTFQKSNTFENSLLAKFPTEILEQIIDNLPTASAGLFSLSCHHVYFLTGTQHLQRLRTSSPEMRDFLKLLAKDLPDQISCDPCQNLHRIIDARSYTHLESRLKKPACLTYSLQTKSTKYMNNNFNTTVFKMAMKQYRHFGEDQQCRKLLELLSGSLIDNPYDFLHHREKAEHRIHDGSLFACKWIDTLGTCVSIERNRKLFYLCPHIILGKGRKSAWFRRNQEYPMSSDDKWEILLLCDAGSWTIKSEIQQCRWCRTEYMVTFEHTRTCDVKLTVTIWQNLGNGLDTEKLKGNTPFLYVDSDDTWESLLLPRPMKPLGTVKGEISAAFENGWPS